ncbi:Zn(II)2Cys6 transcription factor [Aspergillus undulatus]|uniref:Zn(II)2Cys6 transcription factor n=1 Tax=Aspergillus undulatus TaxID=1810928 RepID=UPI003CCD8DBF
MSSSAEHVEDGVSVPIEVRPFQHHSYNSGISSPACNRCRSRKVKCDREEPVCGACTRLQLRCSYDRRSVSPVPERRDSSGYTEAGTKRKRTRLACKSCRLVKTKCSGAGPCERCVTKGIACDLPTGGDHTGNDGGIIGISIPRTMTSIASHVPTWPMNKKAARGYIDVYFNSANKTAPVFLHKPSILVQWRQGELDPNLLKCIVAFGLFLSDTRPEARTTARAWIQEVQDDTFRRIGRQSVPHLRILVILLRFRFQAGNFSDAWTMLSIAARSVFTMRLNHEHIPEESELGYADQESNRRLVWAIYHLDRLFSGGLEELTVCPIERMRIRLPCDERSFELGIPSKAGFINDGCNLGDGGIDVHAFKIRLLAIRDRILKYTKGVRRSLSSPAESRDAMDNLQFELNDFEHNLPTELKLSLSRLMVVSHSREASACVGLHALWMLCHCDLYRFCIPGIRESAVDFVLNKSPPDFMEYCQQKCLAMAIRLCRLWSDVYYLESSEYIGDEFLAVSIYQVVQILHHLPHLVPKDGRNSIISLKKQLSEALQLADRLRHEYASVGRCLKDCERLVNALGQQSVAQSFPDSSAVPGVESVEGAHLASRHTILSNLCRDQDSVDRDMESQVAHHAQPYRGPHGSGRVAFSSPRTTSGMLDRQRDEEQESEPGISDMFLLDPFNMQLNDYHDPQLDYLLM